jgi:hypothetical protein
MVIGSERSTETPHDTAAKLANQCSLYSVFTPTVPLVLRRRLAYRSIMDTQILLRRYRQRSVRSRLARLFTQQASPLLPGRTRTSSAARRPMLFGTPCRPPRHRFAQEHGASCSQNKATRKRWWWFTAFVSIPACRLPLRGAWALGQALFAELCWGRHHSSEVRARIQGEEEWTTEQPFVTARELVRSICSCTHGMLCGKKCWRTRSNILTAPLRMCIGQWTQGRSSNSA